MRVRFRRSGREIDLGIQDALAGVERDTGDHQTGGLDALFGGRVAGIVGGDGLGGLRRGLCRGLRRILRRVASGRRADGMHMHGDTYHQRRNERHDGERALDDV